MCGIIGIVSKEKPIVEDIIYGLKELEYRGYDSTGITFAKELETYKTINSIDFLHKMCKHSKQTTAIAHTRWATHGEISIKNTHPFKNDNFVLAHNGIIENIKELLTLTKFKPKTETDTEILLATFIYFFKKTYNIQESLNNVLKNVHGSFAIAIIKQNDETIFFAKKGLSPLIIAENEQKKFIASNECAISESANIIEVPNNGFGYINNKATIILPEKSNSYSFTVQKKDEKILHKTFLEVEIEEQAQLFEKFANEKENFDFKKYDFIKLIGCGSAYIVCTIAQLWFEEEGILANAEIASEWNMRKSAESKNTLIILVSQSGETADTLLALKKAKENNFETLAIVNKENSTLSKEANNIIYINAGPEKSVASSKAFTMQLLKFFQLIKGTIGNEIVAQAKYALKIDMQSIISELFKAEKIIIIGKNLMYAIAQEGSLKIKELTYLNTNAYAAGELKHGYLALVDERTIAISLIPNDDIFQAKIISNTAEIITRKGKVIIIGPEQAIENTLFIQMPKMNYSQTPLVYAIIMQRIAFELAKAKNLPIDKPRNLAKSVTVE